MSSILTNTSAMTALQTLKSINSNLATTQEQISTGKSIGKASDNSAIWAISKTMESDVGGFKAISNGLSLAQSTVAVASAGAEQIVDILTDMKELAISAQSENVDFTKIQADMAEMGLQIDSIVSSSQFNGANLLSDDVDGAGGSALTVLMSLDRSGTGAPTASTISIASADFVTNVDVSASLTAIADVSSAATALGEIEAYLGVAIDAAAALGSSAGRLADQNEYIGKLTDAMKTGIGTLVDADMEEASARLQALQVQQQLGVQSLSIANQAPQTILSLFR